MGPNDLCLIDMGANDLILVCRVRTLRLTVQRLLQPLKTLFQAQNCCGFVPNYRATSVVQRKLHFQLPL